MRRGKICTHSKPVGKPKNLKFSSIPLKRIEQMRKVAEFIPNNNEKEQYLKRIDQFLPEESQQQQQIDGRMPSLSILSDCDAVFGSDVQAREEFEVEELFFVGHDFSDGTQTE